MLVCTGRDWSQVESHVSVTTHRLGVAEVEAAVAPRQPVTMDLIDSASASLNVTVAVTKRMVFYPFFMHLAFFLFFSVCFIHYCFSFLLIRWILHYAVRCIYWFINLFVCEITKEVVDTMQLDEIFSIALYLVEKDYIWGNLHINPGRDNTWNNFRPKIELISGRCRAAEYCTMTLTGKV